MPIIARIMLGMTTALCSLILLMASRMPDVAFASTMTVMGLLSGVATIALFFPYSLVFPEMRAKKKKRSSRSHAEESESIGDIDLTQLSLPGCLLFVVTFVVIVVFACFAGDLVATVAPAVRKPTKVVGVVFAVFVCGLFLGGKMLIESMGYSIMRKPAAKSKSERESSPGKRKRRRRRRPRVE